MAASSPLNDPVEGNPLLQNFDFPPFDVVEPKHVRPGIRALLGKLVRKKLLNKKEVAKHEEDIIDTVSNSLTVHETKVKDLPTELKQTNELKKMCTSSVALEFFEDCKFYPADTKDELHKCSSCGSLKSKGLKLLIGAQRSYLLSQKDAQVFSSLKEHLHHL